MKTHIVRPPNRRYCPCRRVNLQLILGAPMALALLGFFIGGAETFAIPNAGDPGFHLVPSLPELGQMLGGGWDNFFLTPWLAV